MSQNTPPSTGSAATAKMCELCGEREAEFEIRKVSDNPKASYQRILCKSCLATALADDTASIVRITKSGDEPPAAVN